jgi:hypothetical protein
MGSAAGGRPKRTGFSSAASTQSRFDNPYAPPSPVILQNQLPPPKPTIYTDRKYTPIETDRFARAYDWAQRQMMEDYPGQRPTLRQLDSLIKQHLNAQETQA